MYLQRCGLLIRIKESIVQYLYNLRKLSDLVFSPLYRNVYKTTILYNSAEVKRYL